MLDIFIKYLQVFFKTEDIRVGYLQNYNS